MRQACKKPWGQTPKEEGRGEEKEGRGRKMEQRTGERVGRKLGEEEKKEVQEDPGRWKSVRGLLTYVVINSALRS